MEREGTTRRRLIRPAELSAYGKHAVIVVHPASVLKRLPGVELVPVANATNASSAPRAMPRALPTVDVQAATRKKRG